MEKRTKIFIQNMGCIRCKLIVKSKLDNLGIAYTFIEIGEAEILGNLSIKKRKLLQAALLESHLVLMDEEKAVLLEKTKKIVVEMVHYADELPKNNFSTYLNEKLHYDYSYIATLFSRTKGITLERYLILHKIEKVKEMLIYDTYSLAEIANKLHYSSTASLSTQFKRVTGLTPHFFKNLKYR